ncbi:heme ABC transporter ATP-binding protein [Falsihalocynthiibacter arcticus]|uniref:Iron ABC transporter n=1 Tax=Falsihalocynthiibacter arcticus TaxID=1579316 RepID=A0A126V0I9_9RHOB|nr:heme ABC transporter ATP-binding protein [Falsihalocynthiibacter arcticus]AML51804.1 iron ABC transporter [Falsihalocynthiibacter arcticus]
MLQAQNVSAGYGRKSILKNIYFHAASGGITAIVGPNGSGKSTLLKALTEEIPSTGEIRINGQNLRTLNGYQLAKMRGVLPQSTQVAFPFTVLEIVRLGLQAGIYAAQDTIAFQALSLVGLESFQHRNYSELSGGEQQRVQLARVLAQVWEPKLDGIPSWLFLDEPVSSLDIGHQLEIMALAKGYAERGGGVIMVMHDLNLTAMIADQMWMMRDGEVVAKGAPKTVMTDAILTETYSTPLVVHQGREDGPPYILPTL